MELVRNVVRRGEPDRVLLLVHGYGADEHDLAALVPHLDPAGRFLAVCPRGPLAAPPGAAWYHFSPAGPDEAAFGASLDALDDLLDWVCAEEGFDRRSAVVGGFSQGGAMALALALRDSTRPRPAAVLCLSGFLPEVPGVTWAWDDDHLPPVLVQHGSHDPVLPVTRGRQAAQVLTEHGLDVRYLEYPMAHQLVLESVEDARRWLGEVLDGEGRAAR